MMIGIVSISVVSLAFVGLWGGCELWEAVERDQRRAEEERFGIPCGEHDSRCANTELGRTWDTWGTSRCATCTRICEQENSVWPLHTPTGGDCRYWLYPEIVTAGTPDAGAGGADAEP